MSRKVFALPGFVIALSIVSACGRPATHSPSIGSRPAEAWNPNNDPAIMGEGFVTGFFALPLSGTLSKTPWTDTYWPNHLGGLAQRWNDPSYREATAHFSYVPHKKEALAAMSAAELARLSPAEKYDLYLGKYDFPTVASERVRVSADDPKWAGICHGWAPAALNFPEPHPVTLVNPDGIAVPFGSADVKALLSFYQGELTSPATRFLSDRCNIAFDEQPDAASRPECRDTNAAAFHITLANLVGLRNTGFVVEVTRDLEVWNQPVHTFESRIKELRGPSANASRGTVREIVMFTRMIYAIEVPRPQWQPLLGTPAHTDTFKDYYYRLELNARNEIIGGEWLDASLRPSLKAPRPDFAYMQDKPAFTEEYKGLEAIVRAATEPTP